MSSIENPGRRLVTRLAVTDDSLGSTAFRLILGAVLLPHGAQKLLGWFGGYGFAGTMAYFASLGIPDALGVLAIAAETVGGIALLAGFATRLAALAAATNLTVAALLVHLPNGFFMNWFGNQKGEGVEYFIFGIAVALAVVIRGGGRYSADGLI